MINTFPHPQIIPLQFTSSYIPITIQNTTLYLQLNMNVDYMWLTDIPYSIYNSISYYDNITIEIDNFYIQGHIISFNSFTLSNHTDFTFNNFPLIKLSFAMKQQYPSFPLCYHFRNTSYSIIHYLHNNNYIPKLMFTITSRYDKGMLYLGGIPPYIQSSYPYTTHCAVNATSDEQWECTLSEISFQNGKVFPKNNDDVTTHITALFQVNENLIKAPFKFYDFVLGNIFNSFMDNNTCIYTTRELPLPISCRCEALKYFPDMYLRFGKSEVITLTKEMMFARNEDDDYCVFMIECNYEEDRFGRNDYWVIGRMVMDGFAMVFNYEDKEVGFYSKKEFGKGLGLNNNNNKSIIVCIMKNIICMLSIFSLFLFMVYYYKLNINFNAKR